MTGVKKELEVFEIVATALTLLLAQIALSESRPVWMRLLYWIVPPLLFTLLWLLVRSGWYRNLDVSLRLGATMGAGTWVLSAAWVAVRLCLARSRKRRPE